MQLPNGPAHHSQLSLARTSAFGSGGAVAAKMDAATQVGIDILKEGGNAIDAAVATAFAIGVVEPWMNGLGGGGFLVAWLAGEQRAVSVEYPMVSPSGATEDMFPLSGGTDRALFGWPSTKDNANVVGYRSIAVPGTVDGLATALERFGTMSLADVLAPAIALASQPQRVTWHTTLTIAKDLANLRRFPETASIYLDQNAHPPVTTEQSAPTSWHNLHLAATLETIAAEGSRALYEGDLAATIVDHLASKGTPVTRDDFSGYRATVVDARSMDLQGHTVHTIGQGTGGTTLAESIGILNRLDPASDEPGSALYLHKLAHAFRQAFADRFTYLADPDHVEVPVDALLDPAYLDSRAARFDRDRAASIQSGSRDELGVSHQMPGSVASYMKDGSTTHLSVIDRDGNAVSLTQTLLSGWGSRVTVPGTGVLMNNGMMWFDPEPGRPNSVGPNKRPLSNMAPALLTRDGIIRASVGSSGGRKIPNCNAQILANIALWDMPMGEAIVAPRIDASLSPLVVSSRIEKAIRDELAGFGHPVEVADETLQTADFASPTGVARDNSGNLEAACDAWYFPASAR
ncbi:MAG TPA: gamma-glutamyltransferase family protein, partial [Thermomicrobiales bacterium]|nr:gamma-glutamyltransferase family protein [Thermomicrobiales bacterium]